MSSQGIPDDLGAKSADWVLAVCVSELLTSFPCSSGNGTDLGLELVFSRQSVDYRTA